MAFNISGALAGLGEGINEVGKQQINMLEAKRERDWRSKEAELLAQRQAKLEEYRQGQESTREQKRMSFEGEQRGFDRQLTKQEMENNQAYRNATLAEQRASRMQTGEYQNRMLDMQQKQLDWSTGGELKAQKEQLEQNIKDMKSTGAFQQLDPSDQNLVEITMRDKESGVLLANLAAKTAEAKAKGGFKMTAEMIDKAREINMQDPIYREQMNGKQQASADYELGTILFGAAGQSEAESMKVAGLLQSVMNGDIDEGELEKEAKKRDIPLTAVALGKSILAQKKQYEDQLKESSGSTKSSSALQGPKTDTSIAPSASGPSLMSYLFRSVNVLGNIADYKNDQFRFNKGLKTAESFAKDYNIK